MSEILKNWLDGNGLPDCLVIDGHIHVGEWPHNTTFQNVDEAVERGNLICDRHGVDAFCAVGGGYMWEGADYRLGNDFLLNVWKKMPDRLIPFMSLNPNDNWESLKEELDRMTGEDVHCIKLINSYQQRYPGDGPNLMRTYEYAAEHNMIVFNHGWSASEIEAIAPQFPDTPFIFAHFNNGQNQTMNKFDNVYANTWGFGCMGFVNQGAKELAADKLMLGSDGFLNSLTLGIGPVVFANISDELKKNILGLNVARLLDGAGALPERYKKWLEHHAPD